METIENYDSIFEQVPDLPPLLPSEFELERVIEYSSNLETGGSSPFGNLKLNLGIKTTFVLIRKPDTENHGATIGLSVSLKIESSVNKIIPDESKNYCNFSATYLFEFGIGNLEDYFSRTGIRVLGLNSQASLAGVAISTLRGILASRLQFTAIAEPMLPVLNAYQIVQQTK